MALMFSVLLVLVGAVPVLFFAGLIGWQVITLFQGGGWVPLPALLLFSDPSLAFVPDLSWIWHASADSPPPLVWVLSRVHFALLPALAGLAIMAIGVRGVLIRRAASGPHGAFVEHGSRRVQDYQRDDRPADTLDGRREPFFANLPRRRGIVAE